MKKTVWECNRVLIGHLDTEDYSRTAREWRPVSLRVLVNVRVSLSHRPARTIDLEPAPGGYGVLSITGEIGRDGYCGQIQDTIREGIKRGTFHPAPGVDLQTVLDLLDTWDRWHLNDLKAGTARQEALLSTVVGRSYDTDCAVLDRAGIKTDRGYAYGSDWLVEPLPAHVSVRLKKTLAQFPVKF